MIENEHFTSKFWEELQALSKLQDGEMQAASAKNFN